MTIKDLAAALQKRIDAKMSQFCDHHDKIKKLTDEIEELEKKMHLIILELEPVESLIKIQNPQLERLFESLKKIYNTEVQKEESHAIDN